jgi:hypothetical protein
MSQILRHLVGRQLRPGHEQLPHQNAERQHAPPPRNLRWQGAGGLPGTHAEEVLPPVRELPSMEMRRVCDGPVKDAFCAIGSTCFNVPLAWFFRSLRQ